MPCYGDDNTASPTGVSCGPLPTHSVGCVEPRTMTAAGPCFALALSPWSMPIHTQLSDHIIIENLQNAMVPFFRIACASVRERRCLRVLLPSPKNLPLDLIPWPMRAPRCLVTRLHSQALEMQGRKLGLYALSCLVTQECARVTPDFHTYIKGCSSGQLQRLTSMDLATERQRDQGTPP